MLNRTLLGLIRRPVRRLSTSALYQQENGRKITVDPFCRIQIKTSCPTKIRPADLFTCQDANIIQVTLSRNQTELDITVDNEGKQQIVNISEKLTKFMGHDEIVLEVPVKADLAVECSESVSLTDVQNDSIDLDSLTGDIKTKNIKSERIQLTSGGNIDCEGTTLAKLLSVKATQPDGTIRLDKVLGDGLVASTQNGSISVKSCYSQSSKFITQNGDLTLNNVHRNCEVNVEEKSNLRMTGFNGNLLITMDGGTIDLQISELHGESVILANNDTNVSLKLAEDVANSTYVHVSVPQEKFHLDMNLEAGRGEKENGSPTLNTLSCPNKLFVQTDGSVTVKQSSWAESYFSDKKDKE